MGSKRAPGWNGLIGDLTPMRIPIVEDEKKTAAYLSQGLSESGFLTEIARHGEHGLQRAPSRPYGLLIVDALLRGGTAGVS